jgi:hypothetical protein
MANKRPMLIPIPIMKPISLTILVVGTFSTFSFYGPAAVSEWSEFGLPNLMEIIPINISLNKIPVDIGTSRN